MHTLFIYGSPGNLKLPRQRHKILSVPLRYDYESLILEVDETSVNKRGFLEVFAKLCYNIPL